MTEPKLCATCGGDTGYPDCLHFKRKDYEALAARVKELEEERETLLENSDYYLAENKLLRESVEELEYLLGECRKGSAIRTRIETKRLAERERLREALRDALGLIDPHATDVNDLLQVLVETTDD